MPYGSIISGLVNAGFDIYNQLSAQSPGSKAAAYSSWLSKDASKYIAPFTSANTWNINVPQLAQQAIDFGLTQAPAVNQAKMAQLQALFGQAMPGWQGMFNQMQTTTNQLLAGQVPTDVQQQIQRNAAFTSLMGGSAGAGTGTTGAITARDLGRTSLELQQTGQQQGTNLLTFARNFLMPQPVDPMSLLPVSDLINASEWSKSATFQANEAMYTAAANAAAAKFGAPTTSVMGGVGSDISSIIGALSKSPQGQSGGSGSIFSMLGSMFGGMFGGGGGGAAGGNLAATSNYGNMAVNSTAGEF